MAIILSRIIFCSLVANNLIKLGVGISMKDKIGNILSGLYEGLTARIDM